MGRDIRLILDDILEMIALIERTVSEQKRDAIERDDILRLGIHGRPKLFPKPASTFRRIG
jgi:hypothetical protein